MSRQPPHDRRQHRYDPLLVLDYIARYQERYGQQSPSQRRIQKELTISAPSVVHNLERRLVEAGLLRITTYGRGFAATREITAAGHTRLQQWRAAQGGQGRRPAAGAEPGDGA